MQIWGSMENEVWKNVVGYEGLYKVSNLGRIKSLYNYNRNGSNILKPKIKRGYYTVGLRKNGIRKWYLVHRLVAQAFIQNHNNYPQINHKNENKLDNNVNNLEWCTVLYNNTYGTRIKRVKDKTSKPVLQYDINMNFIKEYASLVDATKEMGLKSTSCISLCCSGKYETSKGYIWRYKGGGINANG